MTAPAQSTEQTIGIDASGTSVPLRLLGASVVTLVIEGDAAADYEWDVRTRESSSWKRNVGSAYTGSASYDDVRRTGADEIRVRCASGTNGSGDQATITLMASG